MKYIADGTWHLNRKTPKGDKGFIGSSKGDDFNLFFWVYLPEQNWIDRSYVSPAVVKIN
jgi:hypothetical protein